MWHLTSFAVRGIASESIRRPLFCLLLALMLLSHWNLFSMIFLITSFIKPLFQHILINVEDVVSQIISVKIVQSPKPTNQLRFRRLNPSLIISFLIKILRHNISAAVMMMISQKMIWTVQKILIFYKKCYKVWSVI